MGAEQTAGPTADDGFRALEHATTLAQNATTRADRMAAVAALSAPPEIDAVVEAWLDSEDRVRAGLVALEGVPGLAPAVGRLRVRVEKLARALRATRRRAALRVVGRDEDAPGLGDELDAELPPLAVPPGWRVEPGGVWHMRMDAEGVIEPVRVTHAPVVLTGVLEGLDDGAQRVCVEWPGSGGLPWRRRIVPRTQVRDARAIVALAGMGADVGSHNSRDLVKWFAALEGHNLEAMPRAFASDRLGWQGPDGGLGFLLGSRLVGGAATDPDASPARWAAGSVLLGVEEGLAQEAAGYSERGTWEGWVDAIAPIWQHPAVVLGLYASLAAPYLGIIPEAPNMIVDWSGETSKGKTSSLQVAASPWGLPDPRGGGLIHSWKATSAGIERLADLSQHLPLFLDDTKQTDWPLFVRDMIYMVAGGTGKVRARPDGLRRTARWRMPLLSTGESPITSFSQDAGARARCLCLVGNPFGDADRSDEIVAMSAALAENHGIAGRMLIEALAAHRRQWPTIRERYAEAQARWTARGSGGPSARIAATMALLEMGSRAAHLTLGLREPDGGTAGVLEYAWTAATAGVADTDRPLAALEAVWRWAVSHASEFWGRQETTGRPPYETVRQPSKGWAGSWSRDDRWDRIGFVPEALERVLRYHGHEPAGILNAWHERGWLMGDGRNRTVKLSIDRERPRLYAVARDTLVKLGIDAD